jgi:hypothetical protein
VAHTLLVADRVIFMKYQELFARSKFALPALRQDHDARQPGISIFKCSSIVDSTGQANQQSTNKRWHSTAANNASGGIALSL